MNKDKKRMILSYLDKYYEFADCKDNESLFAEAENILPRYFHYKTTKSFNSFPTIDLIFIMQYLQKHLMNENNCWSISKADEYAKKIRTNQSSLSWRLLDFFDTYNKRKKGGKLALKFAVAYKEKHSYKKVQEKQKVKYISHTGRFNSNYSIETHLDLKKDVDMKEFLTRVKDLKDYIDCSAEDLIEIMFGNGRVKTKLSKSTLRNYLFDS